MSPTKAHKGRFPNEVYTLILDYVTDFKACNICIEVSRTSRDFCHQETLYSEANLMLPSEACKNCGETDEMQLARRRVSTGVELEVQIEIDGRLGSRRMQNLLLVNTGIEGNRRSLMEYGISSG